MTFPEMTPSSTEPNRFLSVSDMPSVYDFVEETMEKLSAVSCRGFLDKALQYEAMKEEMGFEWWSIRKEGSEMKVAFDDPTIESDVSGILGNITTAKRLDDLCIQVCGITGETVTLGLSDFKKTASYLSERLNNATTHQFCSSLNMQIAIDDELDDFDNVGNGDLDDFGASDDLSDCSSDDRGGCFKVTRKEKQHNLSSEEDGKGLPSNDNVNTDVETTGEKDGSTPDSQDISGDLSKNWLIQETATKKIGIFDIPLKSLKLSTGEEALRALDPRHVDELRREIQTEYDNGHEVCLPPALGVIVDSSVNQLAVEIQDIHEMFQEGELEVKVIDGNHTCHVLKELSEKYPEAECFQKRKVVVYRNLDQSMTAMLALLSNEEASNSLKTADFYKVKVMRDQLFSRFEGKFTSEYQQSMYMIFNALCPNDPVEEKKRKKSLQHLQRIATTDDQTWEKIANIIVSKPSIKISAFRELGRLTVNQSLELLEKVEKGEIRLSKMKELAKQLAVPEGSEELTFKRIRKKKQTQITASTKKNVDMESSMKGSGTDSRTEIAESIEKIRQLKESLLKAEKERDYFKQQLKSRKLLKAEYLKVTNERNTLLGKLHVSKDLESRLKEVTEERDDLRSKLKQRETEILCQSLTNDRLRNKIKMMKAEPTVQDKTKARTPKLPFTEINENPKESVPDTISKRKALTNERQDCPNAKRRNICQSKEETESKDRTENNDRNRKLEEDGQADVVNVAAVEWNRGKVYLGAYLADTFTYCKSPLGQIVVSDNSSSYVRKETDSSLLLNASDQVKCSSLDRKYLIWKGSGSLRGKKLLRTSIDFTGLSEQVMAYMNKTE